MRVVRVSPTVCYFAAVSAVIVITTDAFGGFGGISQYNRDFLSALAQCDSIDNVVALPRHAPGKIGRLPPKIEQRTDCIDGIRSYAIACATLKPRTKPAFVLCGHVNLLPLAVPVALRFRVPLVLMVYGIDVWTPPRMASQLLLGTVDRVVTISQITQDKAVLWSRLLAKKAFELIPNAIDLNAYSLSDTRPEYLLERYKLRGRRVLMTLARLVALDRYKGVDEVLELMPTLLQLDPTVAYMVVGDGGDRMRLQAKAAALGVAEHVVFAGRISDEERLDHYHLADAFVMPGRGEGFGFVFLEALASGIPVVASILDGSREAVRFGALGQLCDPRDRSSILEAIQRALKQPRGARPVGLEFFSSENFVKRVRGLVSRYV